MAPGKEALLSGGLTIRQASSLPQPSRVEHFHVVILPPCWLLANCGMMDTSKVEVTEAFNLELQAIAILPSTSIGRTRVAAFLKMSIPERRHPGYRIPSFYLNFQ